MSDLSALPQTDTIYVVKIGDSLSKLAQQFYGDAAKYVLIAQRNNISPSAIITIGQKLVIPALTVPTVEAPAPYVTTDDTGVITVTSTAQRIPSVPARSAWYEDWRIWAAGLGALGLLYYFSRRKR